MADAKDTLLIAAWWCFAFPLGVLVGWAVCDLGAIAHRVRRWLFKFLGTPRTHGRCHDCGKALSFEECTFYHTACERCEGISFHAQQDACGVATDGGSDA